MVKELDCDSKNHEFKSHYSPYSIYLLKLVMLIKKYKILKSTIALSSLNKIFLNSKFIILFQSKHLSSENWIKFKKLMFTLGLKTFVSKNIFVKKSLLKQISMATCCHLSQGNIITLYHKVKPLHITTFNIILSFIKTEKLFMFPLICRLYNKFLFLKHVHYLLSFSEKNIFLQLTSILDFYNREMIANLYKNNKNIIYLF